MADSDMFTRATHERRNRGAEIVRTLGSTLACPACEYVLEGLEGDRVRCPECGTVVDRAALVTAQWRGPWYHAPDYQLACAPVFALGIGGLVVVAGLSSGEPRFAGTAMVLTAATWAALMYAVHRRLPAGRGVMLALLAHLVLVGYVAVVVVAGFGIIRAVSGGPVAGRIVAGLVALVAVAAGYGMRRVERWMATECIRAHLRRKVVVEGGTVDSGQPKEMP